MVRTAFINYKSQSKSLQLRRVQHSSDPVRVGVRCLAGVSESTVCATVDLTVFDNGTYEVAVNSTIKFVGAVN